MNRLIPSLLKYRSVCSSKLKIIDKGSYKQLIAAIVILLLYLQVCISMHRHPSVRTNQHACLKFYVDSSAFGIGYSHTWLSL